MRYQDKQANERIGLTVIPGNENEVGQGIKDSGVPRKDIFLTSKLWNTDHPNVKEGLQKTLDALDVEYLDLYVRTCFSFCCCFSAVVSRGV